MTELKNAVVLLTGATGGFGQELTQLLLAAGSRVICTDLEVTKLAQQAEALQQLTTNGELLASLVADLATSEGCQALFQQVKSLGLTVDVLINNAGIAMFGRMDETPSDQWELMMQLNLLTPMRLSSLFVADMIDRRQGHIVNISSLAGWSTLIGLTHYSASKFGLRGFSEGLGNEVKAFNVKVTAVYPFFSRTPILRSHSYGSLALGNKQFPERFATDPHKIMAATLQGIQRNQAEVFPDLVAKVLSRLQRYTPGLVHWGGHAMSKKLNNSLES